MVAEVPLFYDWLNDYPDDLGEDEDMSWEELGLKPDAPQEAKDAFNEYLKECAYYRHNPFEGRPM